MNYSVDIAHEEQKELVLMKTNGSYKTWRVYYDIHENEDLREEEEREWEETETHLESQKDDEDNDVWYEVTTITPHKETVITKTFESKYIEVTKPKDEEVSAVSIIRELVLEDIDAYDTGTEVNSFILNGNTTWLNKDTRVGLMNSTNIQKSAGEDTTTLWMDTTPITISCDLVIQLLGALEIYALGCYNKTAEHKRNVELLTSVEELVSYNYTEGYPEKLNLTV